MAFDLDGQRVVVAGGSRGIGRSIALAFARAGASVSTCARGARTSRGRTPRSPYMGAQRIRRPATSQTETESSDTPGRPRQRSAASTF
jgi:NAD(P)-dependent dehydrogenase (short-subunit alcohol dehydrogenase family)